jgi:hypothetical protein
VYKCLKALLKVAIDQPPPPKNKTMQIVMPYNHAADDALPPPCLSSSHPLRCMGCAFAEIKQKKGNEVMKALA